MTTAVSIDPGGRLPDDNTARDFRISNVKYDTTNLVNFENPWPGKGSPIPFLSLCLPSSIVVIRCHLRCVSYGH